MGNNRSSLISGSTATTASLNSTSSLPVNTSSTINQPIINLQTHSSGTQSSVSFLKRFRHPNLSNNLDEIDHVDSSQAQRKKNKKLNTFTKKNKHNVSDCIDTVPDPSLSKKKGTNNNRKKIDKNKIISLSASNIIKSSKVNTSESEYTSINEYLGETNTGKPVSKGHIKEESFYESTLDMDLVNNNLKSTEYKIPNRNLNKENELYHLNTKNLKTHPTPLSNINLDTNANLYSEIINKNLSSKTVPNLASDGYSVQPVLPLAPPPSNSKKNHLQPITNFFNKLTKTTKSPENTVEISQKCIDLTHHMPPKVPAPIVPTKAFNPAKEFYNDVLPEIQTCDEDIEEEEDEDESGIYSKIVKSSNSDSNENKPNLPPLPTTHVPNNQSIEEVEINLSRQSDSNEYQSVQEYEFIKKSNESPIPKEMHMYSPIEPLNINNQVYYSFTSDSQEKFELQNEYISRIDVKCDQLKKNKLCFEIDSEKERKSEIIVSKEKNKNLNLINEIENSRNHISSSNHFTVKL